MLMYYIIITLASIGFVIASYLGYHVQGVSKEAANAWMILLRITMGVKPLTLVLNTHSECKILTIKAIIDYFKTLRIRNLASFKTFVLTMLRRLSCLGMRYRRLLGITTFLLIFTHTGVYFAQWLNTGFLFLAQIKKVWLLAGYLGLLMLFVGYITSNNWSVEKFWVYRKPIQYTAYAALVLGIIHLVLLNPGEYRGQLVLLIVYIYLKLVEKNKCRFILQPPTPIN